MLLGITGKARVGKDTFGKMLAEEMYKVVKKRYIIMSYAHALKQKVQLDFDLRYEQLWGEEKEVPDLRYIKSSLPCIYWTGREILQAYGQFYRSISHDFWVKALFKVIDENDYKNVIITDIRHPNEADPIKDRDGYIFRVTRDSKPVINGSHHISEVAMDSYEKVDFTITNDCGFNELKESASEVVKFILNMEVLKK